MRYSLFTKLEAILRLAKTTVLYVGTREQKGMKETFIKHLFISKHSFDSNAGLCTKVLYRDDQHRKRQHNTTHKKYIHILKY